MRMRWVPLLMLLLAALMDCPSRDGEPTTRDRMPDVWVYEGLLRLEENIAHSMGVIQRAKFKAEGAMQAVRAVMEEIRTEYRELSSLLEFQEGI